MRTQAFEILLNPFLFQAREKLHGKELLPGLEAANAALVEIVSTFERQREEISSNLDLSPAAQSRLTAEVRQQALDKVDGLKDLSAQESRLREKAFSSGPAKSEIAQVLDFLRQQEVRRALLSGLDELQLQALLQKALAEGQDFLLDAALSSPVPLLSEDKLAGLHEQRVTARLEKENPSLLSEFEDLQLINGLVKGMKNTTRSHLRA